MYRMSYHQHRRRLKRIERVMTALFELWIDGQYADLVPAFEKTRRLEALAWQQYQRSRATPKPVPATFRAQVRAVVAANADVLSELGKDD